MKYTLLALVSILSTVSAQAANMQARDCQIFIKGVRVDPSSHGASSIAVLVKVNYLGNGETIQQVGFRTNRLARDLGNDPQSCHQSMYPAESGWFDTTPNNSGWANDQTQIGESIFLLPIATGSVINACPGTNFTHVGAFFVRTNQNTYWINPELDGAKNYVFDMNALEILQHKGGVSNYRFIPTDREDMRYYNPARCR
jgi:hypothetical protein